MNYLHPIISHAHKIVGIAILSVAVIFAGLFVANTSVPNHASPVVQGEAESGDYWFLLKRESNIEYLYFGKPGNVDASEMIREFTVKTGIPGERPTPLPQLVGREYWLITDKFEVSENPEIAPYFLKLDIPYSESYPYGPEPYLECGGQCNWDIPGSFGLHGINLDTDKMSPEDPGSSGCIRHFDEDITYLYFLLEDREYRYYILPE